MELLSVLPNFNIHLAILAIIDTETSYVFEESNDQFPFHLS